MRLGDDTMDEDRGQKMTEAEITKAAQEEAKDAASGADPRVYQARFLAAYRAAYIRIKQENDR